MTNFTRMAHCSHDFYWTMTLNLISSHLISNESFTPRTHGGTDSAGDVLKQGTKFGYANDLVELGEELGSGAAAKAGHGWDQRVEMDGI